MPNNCPPENMTDDQAQRWYAQYDASARRALGLDRPTLSSGQYKQATPPAKNEPLVAQRKKLLQEVARLDKLIGGEPEYPASPAYQPDRSKGIDHGK